MAAPRPPPVISVSAPAFYAPQKKFAPVVAPKPKVNPFRSADGEPSLAAAGAQRAQMGRVGEIPPPPPEDFPLPPPPLLGDADESAGALGGAFPPPPPPIEEPFPPAPLDEDIFPSPPPPVVEEGGAEAPVPLPPQPREKVSSIDLEIDSLSSLLDDMTKNDPFKARVSSGYVPPPVATPFVPKSNTKPATGGAAPLPPWKTPPSTQPPAQAQPQSQALFHVQPQAKPQPGSSVNSQARGPPAPSPAPKFSPVAPKFTPVASKWSPGAPSGPGPQPNKKLGPPEAPSSSMSSPQPPSFNYAQQREKPQVQEKQQPAPLPPAQNQVRSPGAPGPLTLKEVEELEQLTQQLMQDMEQAQRHSVSVSTDETCGQCQNPLIRAEPAVRAMNKLFHLSCFICHKCSKQLQGQQFYNVEGSPYCEGCYTNTLEKCNSCQKPITEHMLRASGKVYHPKCFTCVVCGCLLEGTSFIMDQANKPHCVPDYHKTYAPKCSVCSEPIMPEPGCDETVRVVALEKNFHMKCYKCEDCQKLLSIQADDEGCFPLDGHVLCRTCHTARVQS
ncbi:zyxin [Thomomys bottae]